MLTEALYNIGKAFIRERKISTADPSAAHEVAMNEVFFTYPLRPNIKKGKDGKEETEHRMLRVIVQYRTAKQAVAVLWREPEDSFQGFQLSTAEAIRLGGKSLPLDPKNTKEIAASTTADAKV